MATYLTRTPSSTGNRDKWTFSSWVKRGTTSLGTASTFFSGNDGSSSLDIKFRDNDTMEVYNYLNSGYGARLITNRVFRDTSAWYHVVVVYDSGNSTEAHRLRIYINGGEVTSFGTTNYPSLNEDSIINVSGAPNDIGRQQNGSQFFFGYLAQTILADGQAYAPTVFGSTNADGIWVPITNPSVTYGTNGFKLEYKDSGASAAASNFGADTSGNNNHFSSVSLGTNPNTTDSPANNFAILNINDRYNSYQTQSSTQGPITKAGRKFATGGQLGGSERYYNTTATIAIPSAGKWYWEAKPVAGSNGLGFRWTMGLQGLDRKYSTGNFNEQDNSQGMWASFTADGKVNANGSTVATYSTIAVDDIVSFKYDADNRDLFIAKNGTYFNSGNAVLTSSNISDTDQKLVFLQNGSDGSVATEVNFGNPPYTIASGNSDANGHGNFEYAVPTGYYALCSKNVGLYGG